MQLLQFPGSSASLYLNVQEKIDYWPHTEGDKIWHFENTEKNSNSLINRISVWNEARHGITMVEFFFKKIGKEQIEKAFPHLIEKPGALIDIKECNWCKLTLTEPESMFYLLNIINRVHCFDEGSRDVMRTILTDLCEKKNKSSL